MEASEPTKTFCVQGKREAAEHAEPLGTSKRPRVQHEDSVRSNDQNDTALTHKPEEKNRSDAKTCAALQMLTTAVEADVAEDKGSRITMEDAWVMLLNSTPKISGKERCSYFAIFDGHGGRHAAEYARAHLHANILAAGLPLEVCNQVETKAAKKAIIDGFKKTDEILLQESLDGGWQDGATAVCVWIIGQMVLVANIGDAKAVLARIPLDEANNVESAHNHDASLKSVLVTREHKAIFPVERARIQKAGGFVADNGRLLGRLEVSRAFGDRQFKKVGVSAIPDVHVFELTLRERFLILGCDGFWGVFGPSDAVDFVSAQLKDGATANMVCKRLVREAIRERRCKDNCTVMLIVFKHSSSME